MPELLDAGLDAWIRERGEADSLAFVRERHPRKNPALHAELRMIIDDRTERQRRWAFRAIAAENAMSALSRLRNAVRAIGLDSDTANRQLFVLRTTPWPNGRKTEEERADFAARGGLTLPATVGDLKTFAALRTMLAERHPDLNDWLVARQPAHGTDLLRLALGDVVPPGTTTPPSPPGLLRQAEGPQAQAPARTQRTPSLARRSYLSRACRWVHPGRRDDTARDAREPGSRAAAQARSAVRRGRIRARPSCCAGSSRSAPCKASRRSSWTRTMTWPGWATHGRSRPSNGPTAMPSRPACT